MALQLSDPSLLRNSAYINGDWRQSTSGSSFCVTNPATGEVLAEVADLGATETRQAIAAAELAMIDWRQATAKARSIILYHSILISKSLEYNQANQNEDFTFVSSNLHR